MATTHHDEGNEFKLKDKKRRNESSLEEETAADVPPTKKTASLIDVKAHEFVTRPTDGWTIESFPKPKTGAVLLLYTDSGCSQRYIIPVEKIDDQAWEVLICLDGTEIHEQAYYDYKDNPGHYTYSASESAFHDKLYASEMIYPSNPSKPSKSFECFKEYKLPDYARPTNFGLITAVIQVRFYYVQEF
jgi:hypothetical protein